MTATIHKGTRTCRIRHLPILLLCFSSTGLATLGSANFAAAQETKVDQARRHFRLGVALFQERNFAGALAEFEASFDDSPSATALQNIALCQTKLFRYAEAFDSLEKLEKTFVASLSAEDRKAATDAKRDLQNLVGTVRIRISPPDADVTINGKPVANSALNSPIRLSSGEYRLSASAPSYASAEEVFTVAGGEERAVELTLRPDMSIVSIVADDPEAAIAIDRQPLSYGRWSGPISPGTHSLEVYKTGYLPYRTQFTVRAGDQIEMKAPIGLPSGDSPGVTTNFSPLSSPRRSSEPDPRGLYGLFTASSLLVLGSPDNFVRSSHPDITGGFFGLRAGYRFWENIAFEGHFDTGEQSVSGSYTDPRKGQAEAASYELASTHIGGNVRMLYGGRVSRLSAVFGVGGVIHSLQLGGREASGNNSYLMVELAAQFNVGHILLEMAAMSYLEGSTNIKDKESGDRFYTNATVLPHVGIGFRAGIGQWGAW